MLVTQPDGSANVATEAVANGVTLRVTPSLKIPDAAIRSAKLEQRLQSLAEYREPAEVMSAASMQRGGTAPTIVRHSLVDKGGMMPHEPDEEVIMAGHPHGLIAAAIAAFKDHYPLALRPQHVWLAILQAMATHVDLHAEELRASWVAHEGKKELVVRRDAFVLGKPNDWAGVVDGHADSFSSQIAANVVEGVAEALCPPLSGTSADERIAGAVTVMDITKSFFSFKCMTCCGFPSVLLEGQLADWQQLRASAEALLSQRCTAAFAKQWGEALLPLLDKFASEYQAGLSGRAADERFWNSMVKRGGTYGSGARTWFSGWINILFPYLEKRPNRFAVPYSPSNAYVREGRDGSGANGPDVADFPKGLAEAPVTWDYHGTEMKLKFKAGFVGATQDRESKIVRPRVGWFISREMTA